MGSLENLQLLCCNCHALTDNWRNRGGVAQSGRGMKFKISELGVRVPPPLPISKTYECSECGGKKKSRRSKLCLGCSRQNQRRVNRPSKEQLKQDILQMGYSATGRKYKVSDNAIRKWLNDEQYYKKS